MPPGPVHGPGAGRGRHRPPRNEPESEGLPALELERAGTEGERLPPEEAPGAAVEGAQSGEEVPNE